MPIQDALVRLRKYALFEDLSPQDLEQQVAPLLQERVLAPGAVLFSKGDAPDRAYLVESGQVRETVDDSQGNPLPLRLAEEGAAVGLRALLDNRPRPTTAKAVGRCQVLELNGQGLQALVATFPALREAVRRTRVVNRLLAVPLFKSLTPEQLLDVADLAQVLQFAGGETIFSVGDPSDALYVIDTGQVLESVPITTSGSRAWPTYLSAGSFFGASGLLHGRTRRARATTVTEVRLLRFGADAFRWLRIAFPGFEQSLGRLDVPAYLARTPLFDRLDQQERNHLAGFFGQAHIRPPEVLYHQGEFDPTLYILAVGEAVVRRQDAQGRDRPQSYLRKGNWVGEAALFRREPRDVTVVAASGTDWLYLTRDDLEQYLAQHPAARAKLDIKAGARARRPKRLDWMVPEERLVLFLRRHWAYLAILLLWPGLLALVAAAALLALPFLDGLFYFLLALAGLGLAWRGLDWWNDYIAVTTRRIAHREKLLFVRESLDETPLDKIQNVNTDQDFWGNHLGYGTLLIDTAAATATGVKRVRFTYLAGPEAVRGEILKQMERIRARAHLETRQGIRDRLDAVMGEGYRPVVARPALPAAAPPPSEAPPPPGLGRRVYRQVWWRWFWIEKREADRITWRKHWIRLVLRIWLPTLLLGGLAWAAVSRLAGQGDVPGLLLGAWLAAVVVFGFWWWWVWKDWGNDLYIVTDDRLIDTEVRPLGFRTKKTETTFDRIQNVSYEVPNPIATLLGYGSVDVFTAGAQGKLTFSYVRSPQKVHAEIFRRLEAFQADMKRKEREAQRAGLPQWFAEYDRFRRV